MNDKNVFLYRTLNSKGKPSKGDINPLIEYGKKEFPNEKLIINTELGDFKESRNI